MSASEQALVESWRELADRHARVTGALERVLQDEHGLGVSEFEVLERLADRDKDQHRMQDLAESVYLSQSALSRLIGRLESEGLVTRAICSEDRRGIFACLTEQGRARYEAARSPRQRRVLRRLTRLVRALVQRVSRAAVEVDGEEVASIGLGLLVLLGVRTRRHRRSRPTGSPASWSGCASSRTPTGKLNLSVRDVGGELLCVSQFTLYGDARKGNRPSFVDAAPPEQAEPLYERVRSALGAQGGAFGAHMQRVARQRRPGHPAAGGVKQ